MALPLNSQVAILRQTVAMVSPGERAISREQAFVILERLDQVEAQLRPYAMGCAGSWPMLMVSRSRKRAFWQFTSGGPLASERRAVSG